MQFLIPLTYVEVTGTQFVELWTMIKKISRAQCADFTDVLRLLCKVLLVMVIQIQD